MAKETIELSFLVDVAEFVLNLPKTVTLKQGDVSHYAVENSVEYTITPSVGLSDKVSASVITDGDENKFLQIKVAEEVTEEIVGTITITPADQETIEIGVKVEGTTVEPKPEPKPDVPVEKPDINDDTDVPSDNALFLQFIGITANQKIEVKERRNKIVYFRTNGDRYSVASAVEGNVSVQTVEEEAKEKDGNPYKVVKLKIVGIAKSSDVKITVSAERGEDEPAPEKPETTITVNEAISVEKEKTAKLDVATNAADYSYEITSGNENITVEKTEGGINITGVEEGSATIVVKATVEGGEEKSVTVTVTVTAAVIDNPPTE